MIRKERNVREVKGSLLRSLTVDIHVFGLLSPSHLVWPT